MGQLEVNSKLSRVVCHQCRAVYITLAAGWHVHKCVMQMQLRMFCKQVCIFAAGNWSGMHFIFMGPQQIEIEVLSEIAIII